MSAERRTKVILYGSEHCKNCHPVKAILESHNVRFAYVDITSGMPELQYFLKLRDESPVYESVRGSGKIGIPCLEINDEPHIVTSEEHAEELIKEFKLDVR